MNENDPIDSDSRAEPTAGENASPLDHIVDNTEELGDCRTWIHDEFIKGTDADSILAELIANGWPTDEAEGLVEEGRRATRRLRGGLTREDISRSADSKYRRTLRFMLRLGMAGLIVIGVVYGCYAKYLADHPKHPVHQIQN